ncbi:MAG: hypothetical protein ACK5T0_03760 [Vampirovibrionales bacterium]
MQVASSHFEMSSSQRSGARLVAMNPKNESFDTKDIVTIYQVFDPEDKEYFQDDFEFTHRDKYFDSHVESFRKSWMYGDESTNTNVYYYPPARPGNVIYDNKNGKIKERKEPSSIPFKHLFRAKDQWGNVKPEDDLYYKPDNYTKFLDTLNKQYPNHVVWVSHKSNPTDSTQSKPVVLFVADKTTGLIQKLQHVKPSDDITKEDIQEHIKSVLLAYDKILSKYDNILFKNVKYIRDQTLHTSTLSDEYLIKHLGFQSGNDIRDELNRNKLNALKYQRGEHLVSRKNLQKYQEAGRREIQVYTNQEVLWNELVDTVFGERKPKQEYFSLRDATQNGSFTQEWNDLKDLPDVNPSSSIPTLKDSPSTFSSSPVSPVPPSPSSSSSSSNRGSSGSKKSTPPSIPQPPPNPEPPVTQNIEKELKTGVKEHLSKGWLWGGLALGIAAVLGIVYTLNRSKKKQVAPVPPQAHTTLRKKTLSPQDRVLASIAQKGLYTSI